MEAISALEKNSQNWINIGSNHHILKTSHLFYPGASLNSASNKKELCKKSEKLIEFKHKVL